MQFVLLACFLFAAVLALLAWRQAWRTRFIKHFPLRERLDRRLAARRPEFTAVQRNEVFEGLREFFLICNKAGRQSVAMPSQAAGDAWREFALSGSHYRQFCNRAFGRFLEHTPVEVVRAPAEAGTSLRRAWRLACEHEGMDPKWPSRLPRLFALDATLGIGGGWRYQRDCRTTGAADGDAYPASPSDLHYGYGSDVSTAFFGSNDCGGGDAGGGGDGGGGGGD